MSFRARPKEITWEALVTRADGTVEDHGVIAYWHRNPFKRFLGGRRLGVATRRP